MNQPVLYFIGGCHVAGYLVEKSTSFVDHLNTFLAPKSIHRLPYTKIKNLTQLIRPAYKTEAAFMFLQLGNFEFSASWKQILVTTTGLPTWMLKSSGKMKPAYAQQQPFTVSEELKADCNDESWYNPAIEVIKSTIGISLYVCTWLLLRKHRQQFQALNQFIAKNPQTIFICMSPFPSVAETHNLLRRLGGWIIKRRIHAQPNLRWVDTHQVLRDKGSLFADGTHLNEYGHQVLAQHLWMVCRIDMLTN